MKAMFPQSSHRAAVATEASEVSSSTLVDRDKGGASISRRSRSLA